jgi:hypothetical protein
MSQAGPSSQVVCMQAAALADPVWTHRSSLSQAPLAPDSLVLPEEQVRSKGRKSSESRPRMVVKHKLLSLLHSLPSQNHILAASQREGASTAPFSKAGLAPIIHPEQIHPDMPTVAFSVCTGGAR